MIPLLRILHKQLGGDIAVLVALFSHKASVQEQQR